MLFEGEVKHVNNYIGNWMGCNLLRSENIFIHLINLILNCLKEGFCYFQTKTDCVCPWGPIYLNAFPTPKHIHRAVFLFEFKTCIVSVHVWWAAYVLTSFFLLDMTSIWSKENCILNFSAEKKQAELHRRPQSVAFLWLYVTHYHLIVMFIPLLFKWLEWRECNSIFLFCFSDPCDSLESSCFVSVCKSRSTLLSKSVRATS